MALFQRFAAWQAAHRLVLDVYRLTGNWPKSELYGLTSQARRTAFSIAHNIAEGSARRGSREFRRYLDMSLGSLSELAYSLLLARDLNYLNVEDWKRAEALRARTGLLTWKLYKAVAAKARDRFPPFVSRPSHIFTLINTRSGTIRITIMIHRQNHGTYRIG